MTDENLKKKKKGTNQQWAERGAWRTHGTSASYMLSCSPTENGFCIFKRFTELTSTVSHFSAFLPSSYFHLCDGRTAACFCFMSRILQECKVQVQREKWEQASRTLSKSTAQHTTDAWRQALRITPRKTLTFLKFPHSKVGGQLAWVRSLLLPSCGQSSEI